MSFTDISILSVNTDASTPYENTALFEVHLTLSAQPPSEWSDCFAEARSFARHTMWRSAWIEGNHIVIRCVPEEMAKYHLEDLKQDVTTANTAYRRLLAQHEQQRQRHNHQVAERRKSLDQLDDMNF